MNHTQRRRITAALTLILVAMATIILNPDNYFAETAESGLVEVDSSMITSGIGLANDGLEQLEVKGRAPKTGYSRSNYGSGWSRIGDCDMRNIILKRDLTETVVDDRCRVSSGRLLDPYTAKSIEFVRGPDSSQKVQIDHVVALSDAWQKGAQSMSSTVRSQFANDPLNLLAVDGDANQEKGDGDAATWLPPNKVFRCQYIARQIAVKLKYSLWITTPEKSAMESVLDRCPAQTLPISKYR